MPPLETADLLQTAVLWKATGRANRKGELQVDPPVELDVRWVWGRGITYDRNGQPVAIDATAIVDQAIPLESIMALGSLAQWGEIGTAPTREVGDLMMVVNSREVSDIKDQEVRRRVALKRYRDVLTNLSS